MPTVYNYHQVTKIFTEATDAFPSPNEEGVWLLPHSATFVQPPDVMYPQQTVQWNGVSWDVIDAPITVVEEVIFGWMATDEEKRIVLTKLANDFMDGAARALGFAGIVDASSMATSDPQNQVERDARALKNWRVLVMSVIGNVISRAVGNTNPMPPIKGIMDAMPKFMREFVPAHQSPGPIHEPHAPLPNPYIPPTPYVSPPPASYPVTPPPN